MSPYPILDNKPIDQWKVVELKEELKRRKLTTKGLKDDLIKRLDQAIRVERENAKKEMQEDLKQGGNDSDAQAGSETGNAESVSQSRKNLDKESDNEKKMDNVDTVESLGPPVQVDVSAGAGDVGKVEDHVSTATVEVTVNVVCEVPLSGKDKQNPEQKENADSKIQLENDDSKRQVVGEDVKPPQEDGILVSTSPNNQVSEVSLNLGIQVKSDSISSDSLSINEKNEFKDNIIADNAKLELDISQSEMVEPSSSDIVPVDGKSHPMDVEEPHANKVAVEDKEDNHIMKEVENNNETADIGYYEKLNLDQTSGEDTMEEDEPQKHVKSNHDGAEINHRNENNEVTAVEEDIPTLLVGDVVKKDVEANQLITLVEKTELNDMSYPEKLNLDQTSGEDTMEEDVPDKHVELKHGGVEVSDRNKNSCSTAVKVENPVVGDDDRKDVQVNRPTAVAEKRKLNEQAGSGSSEPIKRQRKWKTETLKVPESQGPSVSPLTTPKETVTAPTLRRSFSRSDSTASDSAPKERVVPPSQKPPTNSLRIDQFLRPFTIKAVEELLGKTGTVKSFWMDHIKTHCFVSYSSVEEAEATRNAVYNLQWPPNGGRLLVADFVDPQEVKSRLEAPKPAAPAPTKAAPQPQLPPPKQQLPPPPPPAKVREGLVRLPPPPPVPENVEPTILTLDVLFKKTKATPRIYYLPLSEEQVAAKLSGSSSNSRGKPSRP